MRLVGHHRRFQSTTIRYAWSKPTEMRTDLCARWIPNVFLNHFKGKQETMRVVSEEDPRTLKADVSGVPDGQLHRFREPAFILFLYATVFSDSLEVRNKFYIDHDLIRISRNAIGFGAFTTVYKGTLLSQKLNSSPHAMSDQLALDVAVRTRSRRYSTNKSRSVFPGFFDDTVIGSILLNNTCFQAFYHKHVCLKPVLLFVLF